MMYFSRLIPYRFNQLSVVLRISFLVILGLLCPVAGVMVVEFCPDPYLPEDRDEYICLEVYGALDGIVVTDGEGSIRFPPGSSAGGVIVVARDAEAYRSSHGEFPDYEWDGSSPRVADAIRTGRFQLANDHDQIEVFSGGRSLQKIEWPGTVTPRQGQVHHFADGNWDGRVLMLGQSRFEEAVFDGASGVAFVSPDCSREVFADAVLSARNEILVSVYEITSPVLAGYLEEAHRRGVKVEVLVEGGPVGGIPPEEHTVIGTLQGCGIPVMTMSGTAASHSPYRFLHSKYMVIDSERVLVTSENFKENGFPEMGRRGNRGWGVVISHEGLAGYYKSVYSYDSGGAWTVPASPGEGEDEAPSWQEYQAVYSPYVFSGATVTPVISPDTSGLLHSLILGASESVDIEMAYITNETPGSLNPFIADAVNVSRRGVPVRVILDSYYYNVEGDADNDEMAKGLNDLAAAEGLNLEARCADLSPGLVEKIHNKGVIVDRKRVYIGSINWNAVSPVFNREAGVIVEHGGVGRYYTQVFEKDWGAAAGAARPGGPDITKVAAACAVITALFLYSWYRKRKGC